MKNGAQCRKGQTGACLLTVGHGGDHIPVQWFNLSTDYGRVVACNECVHTATEHCPHALKAFPELR